MVYQNGMSKSGSLMHLKGAAAVSEHGKLGRTRQDVMIKVEVKAVMIRILNGEDALVHGFHAAHRERLT